MGESRSPGSGKYFFLWLGIIAALSIGFNTWLDRQENPNRAPETLVTDTGAREVALERNLSGHYVASGEINGHPVTFIVDTGATKVSVPLAVAERVGLEKGLPMAVRTANGSARAYMTTLDEISIGGIRQRGVRGSINPSFEADAVLLGMSFLGELEFTQSQDILTLRQD